MDLLGLFLVTDQWNHYVFFTAFAVPNQSAAATAKRSAGTLQRP